MEVYTYIICNNLKNLFFHSGQWTNMIVKLNLCANTESEIKEYHIAFFLSENECSDYATLSSTDRSKAHVTDGRPKCDHWTYGFPLRWYRFTGGAGQAIANKCVNSRRCQTYMSGWMDGQHPKVSYNSYVVYFIHSKYFALSGLAPMPRLMENS